MRMIKPGINGPLLCLALGLGKTVSVTAQCSSSTTLHAATISSVSFTGSDYGWSNPANASSSDNAWSSAASVVTVLSGKSEYLKAENFGFNLTSFAGICGIEVQIEKSATNIGGLANIQDYEVSLVKNNTIVGANKASTANWTGTDTYYTYGGSNDLWGTNWSVSDVNDSNFGVVISAKIDGIIGLLPRARIDDIVIKVHYAIILPIDLISFTAKKENGGVAIDWQTADFNDRPQFIVQKSPNGSSWVDLTIVAGDTTSNTLHSYRYFDKYPLKEGYYRLVISLANGSKKTSNISRVVLNDQPFYLYPNPAIRNVVLSGLDQLPVQIKICDIRGNLMVSQICTTRNAIVDISRLGGGLYFVGLYKHDILIGESRFFKTN